MPKINSMRLVGVICAAALVSSTYLSYVSAQTSHIRSSVLRMHVVANSSSEADRQLKLAVKDAVTDRCGFLFRDCGSAAEAAETAQNNIGFIKYVAEDTLRKLGSSFEVSCSIGSCSFPTKRYGEDNGILTLPAGDYTALNIMIGSAEGENWWCVMYPPLCFVDGVAELPEASEELLSGELSSSETELITEPDKPQVRIKFKLAELLGR